MDSDFSLEMILMTESFEEKHSRKLNSFSGQKLILTQNQLEGLGQFQSNDSALAVVHKKPNQPFRPQPGEMILALDEVRDPGNLGTIIRIADWYGIKKLVFSPHTAEFYNPKVIQATMGSFTRVQFFYEDLGKVFSDWKTPVYGAFLGGENIHSLEKIAPGVILMGNESNGISVETSQYVTKKITIPAFGHAESLNVAIATAVICDNFKRLLSQ